MFQFPGRGKYKSIFQAFTAWLYAVPAGERQRAKEFATGALRILGKYLPQVDTKFNPERWKEALELFQGLTVEEQAETDSVSAYFPSATPKPKK